MIDRHPLIRPIPTSPGSDTLWTFFNLDLLTAAYRWEPVAVTLMTHCHPESLRSMRNHEIETPESLKALVEGLSTLHFELWFSQTVPPIEYGDWWMRRWHVESPITDRDPFSAVCDDQTEAIDAIVAHYRSMRSGAYS